MSGKIMKGNGVKDSGLRGSGVKDSGLRGRGIEGSGSQGSGVKDSGLRGSGIKGSGSRDGGIKDSGQQGDGRKSGTAKGSALKGNMMLTLAAFIWGMAFVAQSVGMEYVEPFTFNAVRFVIGGLVLIPPAFLMVRKEENRAERTKNGITGGIVCGIALFVSSNFQQFGIAQTSVGKAGFITALYIVIVPVLGIFLKKRVSPTVWVSVALATVGMYLLCITEGFRIGRGDFYVLICAFCFSVQILLVDWASPRSNGILISCVQNLTSGVLSWAAMLMFETPRLPLILDAAVPILYTGVMSCGVAYTLQILGQKNTSPAVASLLMSLESVFSLLAGWVILGQKLSPKELFGCLLVFCAVMLAQIPAVKLPAKKRE